MRTPACVPQSTRGPNGQTRPHGSSGAGRWAPDTRATPGTVSTPGSPVAWSCDSWGHASRWFQRQMFWGLFPQVQVLQVGVLCRFHPPQVGLPPPCAVQWGSWLGGGASPTCFPGASLSQAVGSRSCRTRCRISEEAVLCIAVDLVCPGRRRAQGPWALPSLWAAAQELGASPRVSVWHPLCAAPTDLVTGGRIRVHPHSYDLGAAGPSLRFCPLMSYGVFWSV